MIIRILNEGQYRLKGVALEQLDALDDTMLDALEKGDEQGFRRAFDEVLALIRGQGARLADGELQESDLILPPADTTIDEARELFADYPRQLLG
ncbi:MAG TPA: hypothetical protein VF234_04425 [Limnochordia bacterium]